MTESLDTSPERPADKLDEIIPFVDENDRVLGYKKRGEVDRDGDIYRVVSLWVINSNDEILLAKRSRSKSHDPEKWGPAAAGTVTQEDSFGNDNDYLHAGVKEGGEELGMDILADGIRVQLMPKLPRLHGDHRYISQPIFVRVNAIDFPIGKFTRQEEEVDELRWFGQDEIEQILDETPGFFVPSFTDSFAGLKQFLSQEGE